MGLQGQGLAEHAAKTGPPGIASGRGRQPADVPAQTLGVNQGLVHVRPQRLAGMSAGGAFEYRHSVSARAELCLITMPA